MSSVALKSGLWYTVSNIAIKAIGIFTAPIFTRLLTTADYGKESNFVSWQSILAVFWGLSLDYSIGRAKIDFEKAFDEYLSSIMALSLVSSFTLSLLLLIGMDYFASMLKIDGSLIICLLAVLTFSPAINLYQNKLRFKYQYKNNVLIALSNSISVVVLSLSLVIFCTEPTTKYIGKIIGGAVPTIIIGVICCCLVFKSQKRVTIKYWKYALRYSIPMIPHGLGMILLSVIDRIMIVHFDTDSGAGLYSFAYSLVTVLLFLMSSLMSAWQPWLNDRLKNGETGVIKQSTRELNVLAFLLYFSVILLAPEAIRILGSRSFWPAMYVVPPTALGTYFIFFYSYFFNLELYYKKTIYIPVGTILTAAANILLNLYFIPRYGYVAAAYTTAVSYFLLMLYHWIVYRFVIKEDVIDAQNCILYFIFATIVTYIIGLLYDMIEYRIIVCFIVLSIIIYLNKKTILKYIKK